MSKNIKKFIAVIMTVLMFACVPDLVMAVNAATVTITWDGNGGTPAIQTSSKTVGSTMGTLPTQPTRTGYVFDGWYTTKDTGGTWVTTSTTVPNSNTTYFARWLKVLIVKTALQPPIIITNSVKLNGLFSNNSSKVDYGFYWGTTSNPTTKVSIGSSTAASLSFTHDLTGLDLDTTYYFQAYAGTTKGDVESFKTPAFSLTSTTLSPLFITMNSAILRGQCKGYGGTIDYGFYWGTTANPTTKVSIGSSSSEIMLMMLSYDLTGLNPDTTYYFQAYAGTTKGDVLSFKTPVLTSTTSPASSITMNSAKLYGLFNNNSGGSIDYGFYWGTTNNPTTKVTKGSSSATLLSFTHDLTGLSLDTTYYFQAYAGTTKGDVLSFKTLNVLTAATSPASSITTNSAKLNSSFSGNSGDSVDYGFYWGTTDNPTTKVYKGSSSATALNFDYDLSGLSLNTTYYFKAYAGTAVGAVESFKTLATPSDGAEQKINVMKDSEYSFVFTVNDITSFTGKTFKVKYDPSKLTLVDFAAQTKEPDPATNPVNDTDLQIISNSNGVITFQKNLSVAQGNTWSGVLTIVKFSAKETCATDIKFDQDNMGATPTATSIAFTQSGYNASLPTSGSNTITTTAQIKDQYGAVMSGVNPTYSITPTYSGVTVNSSTGVVTIQSTAAVGTVNIRASYGTLTPVDISLTLTKATSVATSIAFTQSSYNAQIPASGSSTITTTAQIKDQYGAVMSGVNPTYSITPTYSGVTVNSSTGVVTIQSTAAVGTVNIRASYGTLTPVDISLTLTKATSVATSIAFTQSNYNAQIPASGSNTITTTAQIKDQYGAVMSGVNPTYSITPTYSGVTVNSSTGVVTIQSTAAVGTVNIRASYGTLTPVDISLTLTKATSVATSIAFTQSNYNAQIPASGSSTITTTAQIKDQYGAVMSGVNPTYSITPTYSGVTVNSSTGVVTIQSTAAVGTVNIRASYGTLTPVNVSLTLSTGQTQTTLGTPVVSIDYYQYNYKSGYLDVAISWDAIPGATQYDIFVDNGYDDLEIITTSSNWDGFSLYSFVDKNYIYVRAKNANETGNWSEPAELNVEGGFR